MPFSNNLGMYLNLLYTSVADKFVWTGQLRECPKWPINVTSKWMAAQRQVDWTEQSNFFENWQKIALGNFSNECRMQFCFYFIFQSCCIFFLIKWGGWCFIHFFLRMNSFDHIPREVLWLHSDSFYFIKNVQKTDQLLKQSHWWWDQFSVHSSVYLLI